MSFREFMAVNYKDSGVDIERADQLVKWLSEESKNDSSLKKGQSLKPGLSSSCSGETSRSASRETFGDVIDGIGGFASIFRLNKNNIENPCLVSATDGVGTKLRLAIEMEQYSELGQDLVAMCANDLICTGARPLFFLDYFSTSQLDLDQAKTFLKGIKAACHKSRMVLIGGETAEMPGLYQSKDFDCAGFAVGIVDETKILGSHRVKEGMKVIGVSSSGFHSNGFSLLRKLYSSKKDLIEYGERLLTPTHLYVNLVLDLVKTQKLAGVAHITGGGINNLARVLPEGLGLKLKTWEFPEIVEETMLRAGLSKIKMLEIFNCGVGLALIAHSSQVPEILNKIKSHGFDFYDLGIVEATKQALEFDQWS